VLNGACLQEETYNVFCSLFQEISLNTKIAYSTLRFINKVKSPKHTCEILLTNVLDSRTTTCKESFN